VSNKKFNDSGKARLVIGYFVKGPSMKYVR